MNILVTGANGMLGSELISSFNKKYKIFATSKGLQNNSSKRYLSFDLKSKSYNKLIEWSNPDLIIHCGAITDVDYCENNKMEAMLVNGKSVENFLQYNKKIIFISSDAVFKDGIPNATEKTITEPENIYGKSKCLGESYILKSNQKNIIIRTTIVGKQKNSYKHSFLDWIVTNLNDKNNISLFSDVFFNPLPIWNLIDEIEWLINNNINGLFHISSKEKISKYHLGYKLCQNLCLDINLIKKSSMKNNIFNARRSFDQTLSSQFYEKISKRSLPTNQEVLEVLTKKFQNLNAY